MSDKQALALGYMQIMKPVIADLKEKRNKIITQLRDSFTTITSESSGNTVDFDVGQMVEVVRKLGNAQSELMEKIVEHNLHAERADVTPILTRTITV